MSAKGSSDAMTPEEIRAVGLADDELAHLLEIDPSPDFAAKVRARILREPNRRRRHIRWDAAAAAVLVTAAALMAADVLRAPAGIGTPVAVPVISAPAQPSKRLEAPVVLPVVQSRDPSPRTVPPKATTMVLVPPDAQRALQRVVELAARGALSAGAAEPPEPLAESPARRVAPLVVEDLDVGDITISGDTLKDGLD
jgi:hypothetical protein